MDELIERLQLKRDVWRGTEFGDDICELLDEAADALEAMRAEVEMLRDAFSDEDMTAGAHWFGRYVEQKRRAEQLAEEVEALRAEVESAQQMTETVHEAMRIAVANEVKAKARADRLEEALRLALNSHGKTLLTDPPQDAWKVNRVEEIGRALLRDQESE